MIDFLGLEYKCFKEGFLVPTAQRRVELKKGNWFDRNIVILFVQEPKEEVIIKHYLEMKRDLK